MRYMIPLLVILLIFSLPCSSRTIIMHEASAIRLFDLSKPWFCEGLAYNAFDPSSHDGNVVVFDRDGAVYINESKTDWFDSRFIDHGWHPSISPDGTRIVYVSYYGDAIMLIDRDGTNKRLLFSRYGEEYSDPEWTYDGKEIVCRGTRNDVETVLIVRLDGSVQEVVSARFLNDPRPTPDGRIIFSAAFDKVEWILDGSVAYADVWICNRDGSNLTRLTYDLTTASPTMNQDGIIAFTLLQVFPNGVAYGHVYIMTENSPPNILFGGYLSHSCTVWDYSGKFLLMSAVWGGP